MIIKQNYFNQYLGKNYIFENSPRIAIALSGGPDSMCLLFLLNNWVKSNNGSLMPLIIDHQLREESYQEAIFVKNYLLKKNILSQIIKVNNKDIEKKTMAEARKNRFKCLIGYCKKNNILHLFLGHHLDDNLETFMMRKIAGSNFEGLRSIKNRTTYNNVQILRPLIDINKKEIIAYNKKNKIKFVLDPTNENLNYTRTVVRNFLLNKISYRNCLKKDFKRIKENYRDYQRMIFEVFHDLVITITKNSIFIDKKKFLSKNELIQAKIIEIIYRYLHFSGRYLRHSKILFFLDRLQKIDNCELNLAGLTINKQNLIIKFKS